MTPNSLDVNVSPYAISPISCSSSLRSALKVKELRANKRNYSASSLRQVHSILNKALKEAHEVKQLIKNNPMVSVQNKPSQPKPNRVEYLSVAEVEKLLALNDEWTPFFTLMIQTGLRSGEQVGLKWDKVFLPDNETDDGYLDVDLCVQRVPKTLSENPLRITTPKNEESRLRVPFNSDVVRMLKAQKDRQHILRGNDIVNQADYDIAPMWNETGFVFTDEQGNHLDPTKPFRELQNAMKTIGVERHIRIHDLRHTCANLLRREGATIENIQALLGHSSYKTTADIYYSILKDEQKEIIPAKMKATIKVPVPSKTN